MGITEIMGNSYMNRPIPERNRTKSQEPSFRDVMSSSVRKNIPLEEENKAPYSYLAKDGIIDYNGVIFVCDYEKNRICLGDVTHREDCISVPLSEGGSLVVNRENLGDLSKAIKMFSPEDIKRIMQAIAQDTKCQQIRMELEEEKNGFIGL